jgi:hypothetical protein
MPLKSLLARVFLGVLINFLVTQFALKNGRNGTHQWSLTLHGRPFPSSSCGIFKILSRRFMPTVGFVA